MKVAMGVSGTMEPGKIIAVASNKGGVGTTTLATNLAANLARRARTVCLVDLVLQFGAVTTFLNLDHSYTILDAVTTMRDTNAELLGSFLTQHSSGVRVLAEPIRAEDARRIKPAEIDEILDILKLSFDFVVIDAPKEFADVLTLVLDKADVVLFVTEMDVVALRSARRAFDLFQRMGVDDRKIRLTLNRYVKNRIMNLDAVEKALGVNVFWTLPNNYPAAAAAINQGLSIEEAEFKSDIARSYSGLATAVTRLVSSADEPEAAPAVPARRGLFGRWHRAGT